MSIMPLKKNRDFSVDGNALIFHSDGLESIETACNAAALIPQLADTYPEVMLDLLAVKSITHEFSNIFFGMIDSSLLSEGKISYRMKDETFHAISPCIESGVRNAQPCNNTIH